MKIINQGLEKEIYILKHFKINNDEYISYKDADKISVGIIDGNKIDIPSSDKFEELKKVLGSIINNNPSNCTILDNNINNQLEEIATQHINLSDNQLNNLTGIKINDNINNITSNNIPMNNTSNQNNKLVTMLIVIILILSLVIVGFMFKDKLFNKNTSSGNSNNATENSNNDNTQKTDVDDKESEIFDVKEITNNKGRTISSCPNCVFSFNGGNDDDKFYNVAVDQTLPKIFPNLISENEFNGPTSNYKELKDSEGMQRKVFLGFMLDSKGKVTRTFVCGIKDETPFCIEGTEYGYSKNEEIFKRNETLLNGASLWNGTCGIDAYSGGTGKIKYVVCIDDTAVRLTAEADMFGKATIQEIANNQKIHECTAGHDGSFCSY